MTAGAPDNLARFDFDTPPDRRNTDSSKWRRYAGRDILPMWVADMDFTAPPAVIDALKARIDHGIFGYADPSVELAHTVCEAVSRDHGWAIEPDWLIWLPGLVTGLNLACRAVGAHDDVVLTATPVYPPFLTAPGFSDRQLKTVSLTLDGTQWQWDWPALEAAIEPRCRLFMLCNPHNPVGRAWRRDELTRLADLCARHDLVLCSDDIHCGLVIDEHATYTPMASLGPEIAARTITLMAPSKTWNIPGLYCGFAVISNPELRQRFAHAMRGIVPHVNVLGLTAAAAAYRDGGPWRQAMLATLRSNRDLVLSRLNALPGLTVAHIDATYLAWIDCTALDLADPIAFFEHHGVGLSDGRDFGAPGFVRLNFGFPHTRLIDALTRIEAACSQAPE